MRNTKAELTRTHTLMHGTFILTFKLQLIFTFKLQLINTYLLTYVYMESNNLC